MKVGSLIEHLQDFDPNQEIEIVEIGAYSEIVFLGIAERNGKCEITVKTIYKTSDYDESKVH